MCDSWKYTYQCQTSPAQTAQVMSCSGGLFNSSAFPTPTNQNNTFIDAAIAGELIREGQAYSQHGQNLFTGTSETCTKGYGGLKNCCKATPGAQSNSLVAQTVIGAASGVVKYLGKKAIDIASPYVYDAMYSLGIWNAELGAEIAEEAGTTAAASVGTNFAANGLSLSAYGFTYQSAGTFEAGSGFGGANTAVMKFDGGGFVEFNPYVLAAQIAIMYLQQMLSCTSEEQLLAMHKGANLSSYIKEECTSKFLGSCLEYTDTYCSFNSVLAKIINMQGKPQLGLNTSDCAGLTTEQISKIDFHKIDFSEFVGSVTNQATNNLPTSTAINQAYTPAMQQKTSGSAQKSTSAILPSYPTTTH